MFQFCFILLLRYYIIILLYCHISRLLYFYVIFDHIRISFRSPQKLILFTFSTSYYSFFIKRIAPRSTGVFSVSTSTRPHSALNGTVLTALPGGTGRPHTAGSAPLGIAAGKERDENRDGKRER